jgi:hypothetical protein
VLAKLRMLSSVCKRAFTEQSMARTSVQCSNGLRSNVNSDKDTSSEWKQFFPSEVFVRSSW